MRKYIYSSLVGICVIVVFSACSAKVKELSSDANYFYKTPTTPLLDKNTCSKLYGEGWQDTGGGRCFKSKTYTFNDMFNKNKEKIKKDKETQEQNIINTFIVKKDLEGLKNYTDKNPNSVYYIKDKSIRLILTGPKGMKVGDIIKLLKKGRSEKLVSSLIKRVKTPYKEFTLDEIDILINLGLTDNIISEMIDITTILLRDKNLQKRQEFLLSEQQRIAKQKAKVSYRGNQKVDAQGNPIIEKLQNEVIKQGVGMLLDHFF